MRDPRPIGPGSWTLLVALTFALGAGACGGGGGGADRGNVDDASAEDARGDTVRADATGKDARLDSGPAPEDAQLPQDSGATGGTGGAADGGPLDGSGDVTETGGTGGADAGAGGTGGGPTGGTGGADAGAGGTGGDAAVSDGATSDGSVVPADASTADAGDDDAADNDAGPIADASADGPSDTSVLDGATDVAPAPDAAGERPPVDPASGCADGTREGFTSSLQFPEIAACSGGWTVPGLVSQDSRRPQCARQGGDDGPRPDGAGCSAEDLCAEGWTVCESAAEVAARAGTCDEIGPTGNYFVTRQRSGDDLVCTAANTTGTNNLHGCGVLGDTETASSCAPFTHVMRHSSCDANPPWVCTDPSVTDQVVELQVVTKAGSARGGVLCCRRPSVDAGGPDAAAGEAGADRPIPDPTLGCADGTREGFVDESAYPTIAACAGGWSTPGLISTASRQPQCARESGDDGLRPDGAGCSVADLCAGGWHVCESAAEVLAKAGSCAGVGAAGSYYVTRQRSGTDLVCTAANDTGTNNLHGCGALGDAETAASQCAPFTHVMRNSSCDANPPWSCTDPNVTDQTVELQVVTKSGADRGGALCCRD